MWNSNGPETRSFPPSPNGFATAAKEGEAASRLAVVTPSLTAVSHVALATGAPPGVTGIVGNTFHPAGTALWERRRGFDVDPETETLREAADRQGKRVVSLAFPGASQRTTRTRTALALTFMRAMTRSIYPAAILARAGLLRIAPGSGSPLETARDSPLDFAAASGGTGFVVVNRASLPGGVVPEDEAGALVSRAAAVLRATKDEKGACVFAVVTTGEEAAALGPPEVPGQHGFDADPVLDGLYLHVGDGVASQRLGVVRELDVAGRVAARLDIEPPGPSP